MSRPAPPLPPAARAAGKPPLPAPPAALPSLLDADEQDELTVTVDEAELFDDKSR
jgi:hypothetical protein